MDYLLCILIYAVGILTGAGATRMYDIYRKKMINNLTKTSCCECSNDSGSAVVYKGKCATPEWLQSVKTPRKPRTIRGKK